MKKSRRLQLDRETIKRLDGSELVRVAGGAGQPALGTHLHSCLGRILPDCISGDCSELC